MAALGVLWFRTEITAPWSGFAGPCVLSLYHGQFGSKYLWVVVGRAHKYAPRVPKNTHHTIVAGGQKKKKLGSGFSPRGICLGADLVLGLHAIPAGQEQEQEQEQRHSIHDSPLGIRMLIAERADSSAGRGGYSPTFLVFSPRMQAHEEWQGTQAYRGGGSGVWAPGWLVLLIPTLGSPDCGKTSVEKYSSSIGMLASGLVCKM